MRTRPFHQVDVFTAQPYLGNPLAVVLDGCGMDDDQIDALILEASASRTTSRKELTRTEASALIDQLKQATA